MTPSRFGRMQSAFTALPNALSATLRCFPAALVFAFIAACAAVAGTSAHFWGLPPSAADAVERVLLLWPIALPPAVALGLCVRGSWALRHGLQVAILLVIAGLWFVLPSTPTEAPRAFWFCYWPMACAVALSSAVASGGWRTDTTFWDTAWPLLSALFLAGFCSVIAIVGVNLAFVSIQQLFDLRFETLYVDIFLIGFFLLWPAVTVLRLARGLPAPPVTQPGWLLGFARWVFLPLCGFYAVILYVYCGKIALEQHWPNGWVAMPVLLLGACGIVVYQIARPARDRANTPWAAIFCRALPWVLGPLSILPLLAIRVRVEDYGFTEWRLLGIIIASWLIGISVLLVLRPTVHSRWIPLSLSILLVISSLGPFSITNISRVSQRERLETLLSNLGIFAQPPHRLSDANYSELYDHLRWLLTTYGPDSLPTKVHAAWIAYRNGKPSRSQADLRYSYGLTQEVLTALGLTNSNHPNQSSHAGQTTQQRQQIIQCSNSPVDIKDFHNAWLAEVSISGEGSRMAGIGPFCLSYEGQTEIPQLSASGKPVFLLSRLPLADLARKFHESAGGSGTNDILPPAQLAFDFDWQSQKYRLVIMEIDFRWMSGSPRYEVTRIKTLLLGP